MKHLGKIILFSTLLMGFSTTVNAQESFGNAGLEIALPIGDWSDSFGIGIGGSGGYEFGISENLGITSSVGITFLSVKSDVSDIIKSSYMIPIQVGGRYYLTGSREGLFGELMLGMHMVSVATEDIEFEVPGLPVQTIEGETDTEANFSFAPQIGYFINENISLALRYQFIFQGDQEVDSVDSMGNPTTETIDGENFGYLGIKAAFNF